MPQIWYTADLHLGHSRIIDLTYRPFRDVVHMNTELIQRWNAVVSPEDTVWVLGDVALGKRKETLPLIGQLAGRKILVAGNHDDCWSGHRKPKHRQHYYDAGFFEVFVGGIWYTAIQDRFVTLSHFPYVGDSHDEDRFARWRPIDRGEWLLHGHVHEKWQVRDRMINVGVDVWDFTPVSQERLAHLIAEKEKGL